MIPSLRKGYKTMYIDIEAINSLAKLIGSIGIIGGVLIALYFFSLEFL